MMIMAILTVALMIWLAHLVGGAFWRNEAYVPPEVSYPTHYYHNGRARKRVRKLS